MGPSRRVMVVAGEQNRRVEVGGIELGPCVLGEVDGGTDALPQQEVGNPHFAGGSHHDVDLRKFRIVHVCIHGFDSHRVPRSKRSASRIGDLSATAVVECNGQGHSGVVARIVDRPLYGASHMARGARSSVIERSTDPSDSNVVGVQLVEAAEQALMESEDVAYLLSGSDPVLGRETENREVIDVACDAEPNDIGQVFLTSRVSGGARKALALSPASVSVHDASHVHESSR